MLFVVIAGGLSIMLPSISTATPIITTFVIVIAVLVMAIVDVQSVLRFVCTYLTAWMCLPARLMVR